MKYVTHPTNLREPGNSYLDIPLESAGKRLGSVGYNL